MTELARVVKGDDYERGDLIGIGGFGEVYRAYQRSIKRDVAMKVLLPNHMQQEFLKRFQVEAETVAGLEHPYIVPLYDFWVDQTGAYLVMRLYRGGSLQDSLRAKGPWDPVDALRMIEQIGAALDYAHRKSIIHQDIKAANILLDEEGNCYLTDFGIATNLLRPRKDLVVYDENGQEIVHGSPEYMAPEQILRSGSTPRTDIYGLGVLLYETLTGHKPFNSSNDTELIQRQLNDTLPSVQEHRPELSANFDIVIRKATEKTPSQRYVSTLKFAENLREFMALAGYPVSSQRGESGAASTKTTEIDLDTLLFEPPNPYKGLSAFQERDAIDFFGREVLVDSLSQRIRQAGARDEGRFLALIGPSGSGKSSVVRAGLFPNLRRFSADWYLMDMMPGAHPMSELESLLYSLVIGDDIPIGEILNSDVTGLHRAVEEVLGDFRSELVILIDQFEEVFTSTVEPSERRHFLDSLVYAIKHPNSRLRVVITLRTDFLEAPLNDPALGNLLKRRIELVTPMNEQEIHDAIVKPAERVGLKLETGLVEKIIGDLQNQAGTLPLLQFALMELYNNRDRNKNMLTLNAYIESDGVFGAVTRRADEIYNRMTPEMREATQQIFMRLVSLGEGTPDTKRRVPMHELLSLRQSSGLIEQTLERFQKRRLLTFDRDSQTREPTVELAHEILIRRWKVLQDWLEENRDAIRLQRQLAAEAHEWINNKNDKSYLAVGLRLANFLQLNANDGKFIQLSGTEREYLEASLKLEASIEKERQQAIQRRRRIAIIAFIVLIALTALALTNASIAQQNEQRANISQQNAELNAQRERAANAASTALRQISAGSIDIAAALVENALQSAQIFRARSVALAVLQEDTQSVSAVGHLRMVLPDTVSVGTKAAAISPDGKLIVTGNDNGTIRFWDASTGETQAHVSDAHLGAVQSIVFNHDGTQFASVAAIEPSQDLTNDLASRGEVIVWDTATRTHKRLEGHSASMRAVAFAPNGQTLVASGDDGRILLWDVVEGAVQELTRLDAGVLALAFSHDGTRLAIGASSQIIIWDMQENTPLYTLQGHDGVVLSLVFEDSDRFLVSGSGDRTVRLWNMLSGTPIDLEPLLHDGQVNRVGLLYQNRMIVTGDSAGELTFWTFSDDTDQYKRITTLRGIEDLPIWSVASNTDNTLLVVGSEADRAMVWDLTSPYQLGEAMPIGESLPIIALQYAVDDESRLVGVNSTLKDTQSAVTVWSGKRVVSSVPLETDNVEYVGFAISPNGRTIAGVRLSPELRFFDVDSGQKIGEDVTLEDENLTTVAFSPNGESVAVGTQDGDIYLLARGEGRVWDVRPVTIQTNHRVYALAFNNDGTLLASTHGDASVRVWDSATGAPVGDARGGHGSVATSLAFSPDGLWLASGGRDDNVILWPLGDNESDVFNLPAHTDWVSTVRFHYTETERYLITGGRDGFVHLWDMGLSIPNRLGNGFNIRDDVGTVAVSPDGKTLIVSTGTFANLQKEIVVQIVAWDMDLESWRAALKRIANRAMLPQEIQYYLEQ